MKGRKIMRLYIKVLLPHRFNADFVVFDKIILEVKGRKDIIADDFAQSINYLKVSENSLALLVNFGEPKLNSRRIVL